MEAQTTPQTRRNNDSFKGRQWASERLAVCYIRRYRNLSRFLIIALNISHFKRFGKKIRLLFNLAHWITEISLTANIALSYR